METVAKILIVDDSELVLKLASRALQDGSWSVTTCTDGFQAAQFANNQQYDMIFLDMQMPGITGVETLHLIRKSAYNKASRIVSIAAVSKLSEKLHCLELGFDDCLNKPFTPEQLHRKVKNFITKKVALDLAITSVRIESLFKDQPEYQDLIAKFLDSLQVLVSKITTALEHNDYDEISRCAHILKGTGGMVGYPAFSEIGEKIETAANHYNRNDLQLHVKLLQCIFAKTLVS
jgi:two-component system sensor histidine kinase BarA